MSEYRRLRLSGGTHFITQVTYQREPWLVTEAGRKALRHSLHHVQEKYPFEIEAFVLLPDHFHGIFTLPEGDKNLSIRMALIKRTLTKYHSTKIDVNLEISASRKKRNEGNLWQRRFWDHVIQDDADFVAHCDYIHYNPVKHGLCDSPRQWPFSSLHRFIRENKYPSNWGDTEVKISKIEFQDLDS